MTAWGFAELGSGRAEVVTQVWRWSNKRNNQKLKKKEQDTKIFRLLSNL